MIHYIAQTNFYSENLVNKISEMYAFSNVKELTQFIKASNLRYDCEVLTQQSDEICLDMAKDYAKKGLLEADSEEENFLINYVKNHNYILVFPVFKLNITKKNGNFNKFKEATIINGKIYLLQGADKHGVFTKLKSIE